MKTKGYVLTMDAVIALIFVLGIFIAVLNLQLFNPDEKTKTMFLNLHYASEDSLDVLNKRGILDDIGYNWSIYTNESLEGAENLSKYYLNLIIPKNVGYKLEIVEDGKNYTITDSDNETNGTRPKRSDSTILTHSSRFLVGFGKEKPVIGSVARAYVVAGKFNMSDEDLLDIITCESLEGGLSNFFGHDFCSNIGNDACCVDNECDISNVDKNSKNCFQTCYGINCTLGVSNNVNENFDSFCCGLGIGPCEIIIGNNLKGDNKQDHSTTVTCCGPGCSTNIGNNIEKRVDVICCGEECNTFVDTGNQQIQNGPNYIGCMGDNCIVNVSANKIDETTVFCSGINCSVYVEVESTASNFEIFCCGDGCSVKCDGPYGDCTPDFVVQCPGISYPFCEVCDNFCNFATVAFSTDYTEPLDAYGSENITIYMDTDRDGDQDRNCTIFEWGTGHDDPDGFNPENDSMDLALVLLLDKLNFKLDWNNESAVSLIDYTYANGTHKENEYGDGGIRNPIDLAYNCSEIKFDGVRVENIRSLWGPVQFKLIVWM